MYRFVGLSLALVLCVTAFLSVTVAKDSLPEKSSLAEDATWSFSTDAEIVAMLRDGLKQQGIPEDEIDAAATGLARVIADDSIDRLDAFIEACASVLPKLNEKFLEIERKPQISGEDPFFGFSRSIRDQARLWAARALVRARLFDEALPLAQPLEPSDCIEPQMLLFYRGVIHHALLMKDEAVDDLSKLLENKDQIPRRFSRTAEMMLADIEPLKEDSLDEIARLMNDVSRRLDLGRSDSPVVEREQKIIDKLDKMIEKMEEEKRKQQQQMQQSQSSGGGGSQSRPMDDSQIAGGNGPGDVDSKDLGDREGWGNLPPAERQEALQRISQDLPTHYREAIEAYFRKLAVEDR